jgi:hypothetical protein
MARGGGGAGPAMARGGGAAAMARRVLDEMPKIKERGKVTIIQMQGHPIQTLLKSNTILI